MAMRIHAFAQATGVPAKTIRYYESIGLLPPQRTSNNYREYSPAEIERLRFVASARSLGLSLADIAELLAARDEGTLKCRRVLDSLDERLADVNRQIADLLALRESLDSLRREGAALPHDRLCDDRCACSLMERGGINVAEDTR
jgi:DNA-binding transcriptional MerR regulator